MRRGGVLPGFGLSMGITWLVLGLIVLIPLSGLFLKTFSMSFGEFWSAVTDPRALASYRLSFGASLVAGLANAGFGLLVAWVLVRYDFPGRKVVVSPKSALLPRCQLRSSLQRWTLRLW